MNKALLNIKGGLDFNDYLALKKQSIKLKQEKVTARKKKARASNMAILQHNRKPARMIANGANMQNIIAATIEGGFYLETNFEKKMKRRK